MHRSPGPESRVSFLTHLECSTCGERHDHTALQTVCRRCGKSLLARYELSPARGDDIRAAMSMRESSLWRYRELLPVMDDRNIISLGEGLTPLLPLMSLTSGPSTLFLKEEGTNPTGSFKARGLCLAVSRALELGATELCMPTAGNAGGALAAYAAAAGIPAYIYMPADSPEVNILECLAYGANVTLVDGLISDAAVRMNREKEDGWFDISTLKEPYRLEGKKTIGYEIAEQLGWKLPGTIIYPTGGGTGLIGMWKAFDEMEALGWIDSRRPVMIAVQAAGCAPIVKAFSRGERAAEVWTDASTIASGLRVPKPFADTLILDILSKSRGSAVAVTDAEILHTMRTVARVDGILLCPEGAATVAAIEQLTGEGMIDPDLPVVVFNTGSGLKYHEVLRQFGEPQV